MIAYASRTGTRRNLNALRACDWRLMVSAKGVVRHEGFRYALDNGAWSSFQAGQPFDEQAFLRAVDLLGEDADFIVIPDIVAGGRQSLDFSLSWYPRLRGIAPLLLAVQDGMTTNDVGLLIGPHLGIFIGGSTGWKLTSMFAWGVLCKQRHAYMHVGRVNSARRIALSCAAGAHSFDGSNASRFSCNTARLDRAKQQLDMFTP